MICEWRFGSACWPTTALRPRWWKRLPSDPPDLVLAASDDAPEVSTRVDAGVALYDSTAKIGALALSVPATTATATAEEQRIRDAIAATGTLSNPLVQTFTTWNG